METKEAPWIREESWAGNSVKRKLRSAQGREERKNVESEYGNKSTKHHEFRTRRKFKIH